MRQRSPPPLRPSSWERKPLSHSIRPHQAGLLQFVCDVIAFRIHIGTDVMRDLTGCVAETHPLVECRCTDPGGPALVKFLFQRPQWYMVPPARTAADGLLEKLGPALGQIEKGCSPAQRHRAGAVWIRSDLCAGPEGDRVSREPSGRCHPLNHFGIAPDQHEVDRVTGVAVRSLREHGLLPRRGDSGSKASIASARSNRPRRPMPAKTPAPIRWPSRA